MSFKRGPLAVEASLYQPSVGQHLFSGPLKGRVVSDVFQPSGAGHDLSTLNILPVDTGRAVLVDTEGLVVSDHLRGELMKQWKRWEFEPYVTLQDAFGPTFCYARWGERSLFVVDVKSRNAVDAALKKRFPPNVVSLLSTWSYGTPIWGFEKDSQPAWASRGDQLLATTDGGLEGLAEIFAARYGRDASFRARSPLLKELKRLTSSEKGWHVCIIEQLPNNPLHWAIALRWTESGDGDVEGFLVVWLPPNSRNKDKH